MSVVIGIDIGGSSTKIVGFRENNGERQMLSPLFVTANDPVTSVYGAFGSFTNTNDLSLSDISCVKITGVGSTHIDKPIYSLDCKIVPEFSSIALGGLYLSGLNEAIVVSMGTGTAIIYAKDHEKIEYLGGTGVGGGTLLGLSKLMLKMDNIKHIQALARDGKLSDIDLRVSDISKDNLFPDMPKEMTAANFGNISDLAGKSDIALGIINLVFETIAMLALFAARGHGISDIVLTGNLTEVENCRKTYDVLSKMFNVNFIIPENAKFATAIGAALL